MQYVLLTVSCAQGDDEPQLPSVRQVGNLFKRLCRPRALPRLARRSSQPPPENAPEPSN